MAARVSTSSVNRAICSAPIILALFIPLMVVAVHVICRKLVAVIDSAARGAAFSMVNAGRLRAIGWALLGAQILDLVMGLTVPLVSPHANEFWHWNIGVTGWFAALLLFVLAKVFEQGALMREDLEGTI